MLLSNMFFQKFLLLTTSLMLAPSYFGIASNKALLNNQSRTNITYSSADHSDAYPVIHNKDGYTFYSYDVVFMPFTETSDLAFMTNHVSITSGEIASASMPDYYNNTRLGTGRIEISASSFFSDSPHGQSGSTAIKDFWPRDNIIYGRNTIQSSYGQSLDQALKTSLEDSDSIEGPFGVSIHASPKENGISTIWPKMPNFGLKTLEMMTWKTENGAVLEYSLDGNEPRSKCTLSFDFVLVFEIEKGSIYNLNGCCKVDVKISTQCSYLSNSRYVYGNHYSYHLCDRVGFHV